MIGTLEIWLGAVAIMVGVFGLAAVVVAHRRDRARWQHVRPIAPALDVRQASLQASRSERLVAPLVDAVATAAQRILRPSLLRDAEELIEMSGPRAHLTARRFITLKVLMIPFGIAIALLFAKDQSADIRLLAAAGTPFWTWRVPGMYLSSLTKRRSAEITRDLPDVLDQITISVSAGLGLEAAMTRVAKRSQGALGSEMSRTMQDIRIGVDRVVAFEGFARRCGSEDLAAVVSSIVQCLEMGAPLAPALRARSTELRRKRRVAAEEKAHKLSVKLTFPTAICILPSLMMIVMGPTIIEVTSGGFGG